MSGVSLQTSYTASTRVALSNNMQKASLAAIAMSTGNAITHAYQDPTGLAIGSNMKSNYEILSIIANGIEQSQSMLYIAEDGLKSAYNVVTQMNQVLARAKLGYMTDDLIQKTLSPTYQQLKAEINRIADSIEFNGQKLLNGSGGISNAPVATASQIATSPTYEFSSSSVSLANIVLTGIVGTTNAGNLTGITPSNINVDLGTIAYDSTTGTTTITDATIILSGATLTDINNDTCIATVTLTGVTLSTANAPASGVITGPLTIGSIGGSSVLITNTSGGITSIGGFTVGGATNTSATIDSIETYYPLTGGILSTSTFNFVTGADLNNSTVKVSLPNIKLNNSNSGVIGIISALNTKYNINPSNPSDLTNLMSAFDADNDIPLIQALADELITQLDNIGAYQSRFINISSQLSTAVEQVDLAQGVILNTDLSKEIEIFTRSSVETNVAIAMLKNLNSLLQSLQNLVV